MTTKFRNCAQGGRKEQKYGIHIGVSLMAEQIKNPLYIYQFSSVQSLCRVQLFVTPWTAKCQASLSITNSRSPLKPMFIKSVMPSTISSSVIPFSSCPQSFPASGFFPMSQLFASGGKSVAVSAFNMSPSSEHPGLISFRMDWLDLLAVQGTLKSLLNTTVQKHQFFGAQLSL